MITTLNKTIMLIIALCAMASVSFATVAFPGAEGAGANTIGGRGGTVLFVDNLMPNGVGSFQNAVDGLNAPRIVIFRTSGIIYLAHDLTIDKPYLTIAGQTAPGDGICIKGYAVIIGRTHDIIIRNMRFRPGDISGTCPVTTPQVWGGGALPIDASYNVIIDHCSFSWAPDENIHVYAGSTSDPDCTNVTLQWNIISESLEDSVHTEGPHGCGLLIKTDGGYVTAHHNFLVNNKDRNPRIGCSPTGSSYRQYLDWRNNVVYNWGSFSGKGAAPSEYTSVNWVGNWNRSGPDTTGYTTSYFYSGTSSSSYKNRYQIYKQDAYANYMNGTAQSGWTGFSGQYTQLTSAVATHGPAVTMQSATNAKNSVLANAGATLPARDSVDARAVTQFNNNTGNIINSQDDVGGWPTYNATSPPTDTDNDGMPDSFESTYGVSDVNADADGDGYTNVEEYINGTNPNVDD